MKKWFTFRSIYKVFYTLREDIIFLMQQLSQFQIKIVYHKLDDRVWGWMEFFDAIAALCHHLVGQQLFFIWELDE